ncbi:MAG: LTA synthase family protein [Bacteroidales bacterium]|nr:LTA synthase family protein [Bacteroidales bacterium]
MGKLSSGLGLWIRLNILLLVCMIAVRPLFFLEVYFRVGLEPIHFFTILSGSLFDLLLVCRIFAFGLVPFLCLHWFFPKTAKGVFIGLTVLYAVVSALLAEYYCNMTMPLDHVILVYSLQDLKTTVASSASLSLSQVGWFVAQVGLAVGLAVGLVVLCKRLRKQPDPARLPWLAPLLAVMMVAAAVFVPYKQLIRQERLYPAHYDFCLAVNQPSYSYIKITDYLRNEAYRKSLVDKGYYDENLKQAVAAYHALHPEFDYDHPDYPFYRKVTETDVLGPFFKPTSDSLPPNLVVILVEGLGRRLTGVNDPQLSFTPFIDSLAAEGLFWQHCLSTAERTFGVIPSVFASAPHGRYGFSTTLSATPRHHSLLRDLERNGYRTAFFYGGDPAFDHYDYFMKSNHVSRIFSPQVTVVDSARYRLLVDNHRWGLDDDQLVCYAIQQRQSEPDSLRPFADVYLTLSTHEPFVVDGMERYEQEVRAAVEQAQGLSDQERSHVMNNLNIFACYLYMDECIRTLFRYYASRPDFENTVFVITGDHRMAFLPFGSAIRKYNVPLVIYSPLLKRHKAMDAVVSHLDIAPSINAFLHANYDYEIDDHCHWLGTSFDTVAAFRNTRKLLFMLNNRDVVDYYSGDYLISNNKLLRLDNHLTGQIVQDPECFDRLKAEMDDFDLISRFVVQEDFLLPPETHAVLYSNHLDFKTNNLSMFEKITVRDSAFLRIDKSMAYLYLCPEIAVLPRYQHLIVECSFDVRGSEGTADLPWLVVRCGDQHNTLPLVSPSSQSLNTGGWEHYHTRVLVNTIDMNDSTSLKIYLWNDRKAVFSLDNLVVDVRAE